MVRQTRRPRGRRCSRGSHRAASAAGRPKERVGAMTRVLGMAVFVGSMLAHVPAAAAPVAAAIVDGGSSSNVRTVDVAECKTRFTFEGRTVVGCTTLGSPGNVPWCELATPPADPSAPAWAFCRATGDNSARPRTGRAAGTAPGRTTASGRTSSNPGGGDASGRGSPGNPSETGNGRESPFREARDGEDDGGGGEDEDAGSDNGEDGADGSDDEGDFEDGEEDPADDDGGSEEDPDADPDNGGSEEDPDADPDNGGSEEDPDADPDDGGSEEDPDAEPDNGGDGGADPTGGNADGSDPGVTPVPTEVPPPPVPTGTEPLPTPTGVSPPGSPGAPADGNNTGGDGGSDVPQDSSPTTGLSTAAILGIAVGAAAAAALLLIAPIYLRRKKPAAGRAEATKRASEEEEKEYGSAAPARAPRPVPLAVDNVRSTFVSTYRSAPSSEARSNRSSVSSRTTSQYGPDPSTISFSEAPLGRWMVATNYVPSLSDELVVEPGDIVDVYKKFDDGWVTAVNVSKGFARGVMPMHCLDLDQGQPSPELIDEQGVDMFQ